VVEIERASRLKKSLSPQVADLVIASSSVEALESHRREATVLSCDLRGFTAFAGDRGAVGGDDGSAGLSRRSWLHGGGDAREVVATCGSAQRATRSAFGVGHRSWIGDAGHDWVRGPQRQRL